MGQPNFIDGLVFDFKEYKLMYALASHYDNWQIVGRRHKMLNVPCAFDIETSSFYVGDVKSGCMYCWQFGLNGLILLGRTWDEFIEWIDYLKSQIQGCNLICYVQNLGYEFQWMKHWFKWDKVFAVKRRTPVRAVTGNIEFKCSLFLSGYNLETIGKNLLKYPVKKMVGDLDYELIRHSETPITEKENGYRINDVRVVMAYIQECIEADGDITKIPLTKTGYVRRHCREKCLYGEVPENSKIYYFKWRQLMESLTLEPDEYLQCKRGFQGGFVHANSQIVKKTLHNVGSADFTSDYPFQMVTKYFPMSKGRLIDSRLVQEKFQYYLDNYCCLFDITFYNLRATKLFEQTISWSRCWGIDKEILKDKERKAKYVQLNNGRIVYCEKISTTITELDYESIKYFYDWDAMDIFNFRIYKRGYLPTPLVNSILDFYEGKTKLKGVEGEEAEYAKSKNNLNSTYGMSVTDIVREVNDFGDDWLKPYMPDLDESIRDYNESKNRFLFYPWGIYVTAHARHSLFTGIKEFKDDYCYSDTDSIKGVNFSDHALYFAEYNRHVKDLVEKAASYHKIPYERFAPFTKKGKQKLIGVWDYEGEYSHFKTCGAKRYLTVKDGVITLTLAGLSKLNGLLYMCEKSGIEVEVDEYKQVHYVSGDLEKLFKFFDDFMSVPADRTGKLTHTYIDEERQGIITDYLGQEGEYYEKSIVHMEHAPFQMSLGADFREYLKMSIKKFFE